MKSASMLIGLCHKKYQEGIGENRKHTDIEYWDNVTGLMKLVAYKLDRFCFYLPRTNSIAKTGKLSREARIIIRLLYELRETIINLLGGGVSFSVPVWLSIDESLADIVRRCNGLAVTLERLISGTGKT